MSVLIVEDDPSIATLIASICRYRGWTCDVVPDGAAAIPHLHRGRYGAIVLDLMLPRYNAFEVLTFLRAEKRDLLKRVIVITAASPVMLEAFDVTDVCTLIRKPFEIDDLQDAIERVLSVEE